MLQFLLTLLVVTQVHAQGMDVLELDQDLIQSIRSISDTEFLSLEGIMPRSSHKTVTLLKGSFGKSHVSLFPFVLRDDQKITVFPKIQTGKKGEFVLTPGSELSAVTGELWLIMSEVPDLRLGLQNKKTKVIPLYLSPSSDLEPEKNGPPVGLFLKTLKAFEDSREIDIDTFGDMKMYKSESESTLELLIEGELLGKKEGVILSALLLPSFKQTLIEHQNGVFSRRIEIPESALGSQFELLVTASGSESSSVLGRQFTVLPKTLKKETFTVVVDSLKKNLITLVIGVLFLLLLTLYRKNIFGQKLLMKTLALGLFLLVVLFELGVLSRDILRTLAVSGKIPGIEDEMTKLYKKKPQFSVSTLTTLSADFEVLPQLASSWSQVDPITWEFTLRALTDPLLSPEQIFLQLKKRLLSSETRSGYLSTIKEVVLSGKQLTIITRSPDPLIPQKLSRLSLKPFVVDPLTSPLNPVITLEDYPDHLLLKRNDAYKEIPFLGAGPLFTSVLLEDQKEILKRHIEERSADFLDEPDPSLWPALSKNNYRILPKINTDIVVMTLQKDHFFLKDKELIEAIRAVLQSGRLLQTSYFQYGRLGNQFAPPGVVGYDPKMKIPAGPPKPDEAIAALKERLQVEEIPLKLHFPEQERSLALVIEEELEYAGLTILPIALPQKTFQQHLLKKLPDLTLLPVQFELGDIGPFLDTFIDSDSPYTNGYHNSLVDTLIEKSRQELRASERVKLLRQIMHIITVEDPAGIPVLFKRSFVAQKREEKDSWFMDWLKGQVRSWAL